ncbi:MAG: hypothetical protein ACOYN0_17925 [Phycisphaerales bacterium]
MVLSIIATILLALAILLTLFLGLSCSFFTMRVPSGADAMGLIVPMGLLAVSWLLTLIAAWCAAGGGAFHWLAKAPLAPVAIITALVIGCAIAAVGGFNLWLERKPDAAAFANLLAVAMPIAMHVFLIFFAWNGRRPEVASWGRIATIPFALAFLVGRGFAARFLVDANRRAGERARAAEAAAFAAQAEESRREALSESERIDEDLFKFSADAPLWSIAGYLLDHHDPESRRIVVERARKDPSLDDQVRDTLAAQWASIRGIGLEFVIADEARRQSWVPFVVHAIDELSREIEAAKSLDNPSTQEKIPAEVERAFRAAAVFPDVAFDAPLARLRAAVEACPESPKHAEALARISLPAAR